MPYGDGTGPDGEGPMTGRRMGVCASNTAPFKCGFGRMRRFWGAGRPGIVPAGVGVQNVELSSEEQARVLENQKNALEADIKAIETRLKALKQTKKEQ